MAKMSARKFSRMYSQFYDELNKLLKEYSPCDIKDGRCIANRAHDTKGCCCQRCKYVGKNGCKVKCLGCKSGLCSFVRERMPEEFRRKWYEVCDKIPYCMRDIRISKKQVMAHRKEHPEQYV